MTPAQLVLAGITPAVANVFAGPLTDACAAVQINTPQRIAAFVAQCSHESAGFTQLVEDLYYRDAVRLSHVFWTAFRGMPARAAPYLQRPVALADYVYANRGGNGNVGSGDGSRFIGRGLLQVTFRANYRAAGYEGTPELVAQPEHAADTAARWWQAHGLNEMADAGNIDGITRVVNGPAMLGAADRSMLYALAQEAFS